MKDLFKPIPYNAKSEYYTEPIFDLLYKVDCKNASKILDIGCGTGNSTKAISLFFPNADILGIDNSNSMIEEAIQNNSNPKITFKGIDINEYEFHSKFDIIFSFATLQFVQDHHEIFLKFIQNLTPNGILAIQMPNNYESDLHKSVYDTAKSTDFQGIFSEFKPFNWRPAEYYFELADTLNVKSSKIWEIIYYRPDTLGGLLDWSKTTSMLPYLNILNSIQKTDFISNVEKKLKQVYKCELDDNIHYKQKRIFLIYKI